MAVLIYQKRRDMLNIGSGFYIGPAGSGKTFALRNEIEHVLNNTDEVVFVVSRRGEYDDLAQKYGGLTINLAKQALNPLLTADANSMSTADLNFVVKIKAGLVKLLVGSKIPKLSTLQKYIIDQVVVQLYKDCKSPDWNNLVAAFETMLNTYKDKKVSDKIAEVRSKLNEIAADLKIPAIQSDSILLKDSLVTELEEVYNAVVELKSVASGKEQIALGDQRLIIYDVKDVKGDDVEKYCLEAMEDVLSRMSGSNPIKKVRLCLDDADNLFKQFDKYMAMVYKLSKTIGLVVTSVIHDADIYLNKKHVFRNASSYYEFFNQTEETAEVLRQLFSLNDEETDWIKNAPRGQKLVVCAGNKLLIKAI